MSTAILDLVPEVGQVIRRCPTTTLVRAYLRSARNFCAQTRWLRATPTIVGTSNDTVADQADYTLVLTDTTTEIVGIRDVKGSMVGHPTGSWRVKPLDKTMFDPTWRSGQPSRYAYLPDGQITLYPTPDKAYTITVIAAVQPTLTASVLSDTLVTKWKEVIEAGALEYLFNLPRQSWSNPQQALIFGRAYRSGINNAKADEQRGYNQGPVRVTPRRIVRSAWG